MPKTLTATESKIDTKIKILTRLKIAIIVLTIAGVGIVGGLTFILVMSSQPQISCNFDQYGANSSIPCADKNDLAAYRVDTSLTSDGYSGNGLKMHTKNSVLAYNTNIFLVLIIKIMALLNFGLNLLKMLLQDSFFTNIILKLVIS